MPGGPGVPRDAGDNKGKTATHEVGHWSGLFLVLDGFDCAGEGDMVDDTPATSVATVGCPARQDSCPDQPGLDPVHNYMDYASHDWYVMGGLVFASNLFCSLFFFFFSVSCLLSFGHAHIC